MNNNNENTERTNGEASSPLNPPPPPSPPPPAGPPLKVILAVAAVGLIMLAAGVWLGGPIKSAWSRLAAPSSKEAQPAPGEHAGPHQYYTCGMHPWVVLPKPGDCPICHMKLVPLDPAKFTSEVAISPVMTQSIGVRTVPVASGPVTSVIRTVGTVDYDETLVRDVNLKISGWVEKLYVDYVGKPVAKDQPLLDIYSPDLYTAQQEYLQALKNKTAAKDIVGDRRIDLSKMDSDLLESATKRLEYFDVSAEQMKELERTGKTSKTMTLRSPFQGLVVSKDVFEGMKVEAGMRLYRIADLAKVWIMVSLYEYQVPYLEVGQPAVVSLPYIPGQTFDGKIAYIYPYLNAELRQVKVRIELDNPDLLLKPGMFANAEIRRKLANDRVLVPREAVIDTGERQVAFVSLGEGRFEPRVVKVGVEAENGMLEILDGLKPGENVVVSGGFLLDSESRLREALAKMVKGNLAGEPQPPAMPPMHHSAALPDAAEKIITSMLDSYFQIGSKLADDSIDGIAPAAKQLAANVDDLTKIEIAGAPHFWHEHMEVADIRGKALELAGTKEVEQVREKFADLSIVFAKLLKATGVPASYGKEVQELHCPMYRAGQGGAWWLQPAGAVRNPFFGKKMLGCFDKREIIPVSGTKAPAPEKQTP